MIKRSNRVEASLASPARFFSGLGLILLCVFTSAGPRAEAQNGISTTTPPSALAPIDSNQEATIAPGDLITITVFETPELSGTFRVSNNGALTFPLIGTVPVQGLSTADAAELIRTRLITGDFLKDPQVTVSSADFTSHSVVVFGEVIKPGTYPISGIRRLWDVIGAAGGVSAMAGSAVTITRKGNASAPEVLMLHWEHDLSGQPNPVIFSGDTIQVSRAGLIYVVGQVGKQGAYPITHERLTVAQVITTAGGVPFVAKAAHARLIRPTPSGHSVTEIDINSILKGEVADVPLMNDDIIYVPLSAARAALSRGVDAAIAISTSLAIVVATR